MVTCDDNEIRRQAIAAGYLALLAAQPGRPLALCAPRRSGKTYFLDYVELVYRLAGKAPEAVIFPDDIFGSPVKIFGPSNRQGSD